MGYGKTLVFFLFARAAFAGGLEWEETLRRTAEKVKASSKSIHGYTCVETVQRDYYSPRANTLPRECSLVLEQRKQPPPEMILLLSGRDRLRLEVASSARGEIQSWPGASKFAEAGIETFVREGPIGTGAFGTLLNIMFTQDVKRFAFLGDTQDGGRRQYMFIFAVPMSDSHYRVKSQDNSTWLTVGYQGVLHVDAQTADPVRLNVVTADLPLAAGICQTSTTLVFTHDFGPGDELLLPVAARQRYIGRTGAETENSIRFSQCRQYSSESTISYFTPPDAGPAAVRKTAKLTPAVSIPERLPFSMELLTTIDSDTSAAGDRFNARLRTPIRDGNRTIAPKGALIEGRVSAVGIAYLPVEGVAIGLVPESIQIQGAKIPFAARLDLRTSVVEKQQKKRVGLRFFLPPPGELPHEFRLPGKHNMLARGFVSEWMTASK
jgi:hypothetical protein